MLLFRVCLYVRSRQKRTKKAKLKTHLQFSKTIKIKAIKTFANNWNLSFRSFFSNKHLQYVIIHSMVV